MSSGSISNTRVKGREAEEAALAYFLERGYALVERNHTRRYGEIDLILEEMGLQILVFVEVKSGYSGSFPDYQHAITPSKCKKIAKVAAVFIENCNREYRGYRIDAVFVERGGSKQIQHLKNIYIL